MAAIAAALVFGVSSVAEQRSTKRVKTRQALSPAIIVDLVRQPLWVIAIGATVLGFALQVVALKYGPLAVVEPLLVCDLTFAVLITSYLRGKWDPVIFAGVLACTGGIVGFLAIARPTGGNSAVSLSVVIPLAAALAAVVAGCLAVARRNRRLRPLALALACGVNYGVAAFVVKVLTADFGHGLGHVFTTWPIYAIAIIGPVGFVLNQDAFQSGTLLAPVMAILTAADPIVSIGLAYLWLDENLSSSPAAIFGEIATLGLMILGIYILAHHSPVCVAAKDRKQEATTRAGPAGGAGGTGAADMPAGPADMPAPAIADARAGFFPAAVRRFRRSG